MGGDEPTTARDCRGEDEDEYFVQKGTVVGWLVLDSG